MACCLSGGVPCPYSAEGVAMDCRMCPYSDGEAGQ